MHMLVYLILAAVVYGVLAEHTDRAVEREMRRRQPDSANLRLLEDFDPRPDPGPWYGRLRHRPARPRAAIRAADRSRPSG
jgi:hypothetical protein